HPGSVLGDPVDERVAGAAKLVRGHLTLPVEPSHSTALGTGARFCLNGRMNHSARIALAAAMALAAAGCQTAAPKPDTAEREEATAPAAKLEWPLPEGWRSETIPFPLDFARDLPLEGVEELRFAPGMFKTDRP